MYDISDNQLWLIFINFCSKALMSLGLVKKPLINSGLDENENMVDEEVIGLIKENISSYSYDAGKHVMLIAVLRLSNELDIGTTMSMLDKAEKDGSCSKVKKLSRVFDVLSALKEDLKDGFMEPDEDDLLDEALKDYVADLNADVLYK